VSRIGVRAIVGIVVYVLLLRISFVVEQPGSKPFFAIDKVSAEVFKFVPWLDKALESWMKLGWYA
jgi:hypothetical protein